MAAFVLQGRYFFQRRLHAREHVTWYEAVDQLNHRQVRIQRIPRDREISGPDIDREVALLKFLDRHQVPCTTSLVEEPIYTDRYVYLIFPYFQGHSLYDFISLAPKKLILKTEEDRRNFSGLLDQIMLHLVKFVRKLHHLGLVHRHLDLHSILLNRHSGQVEVIDFSYACVLPGTRGPALELVHHQGFGACVQRVHGVPGFVDPALLKKTPGYPLEQQDHFALAMVFLALAQGVLVERWKSNALDECMRHIADWPKHHFINTGDTRLDHLIWSLVNPDLQSRASMSDLLNVVEGLVYHPRILKLVKA